VRLGVLTREVDLDHLVDEPVGQSPHHPRIHPTNRTGARCPSRTRIRVRLRTPCGGGILVPSGRRTRPSTAAVLRVRRPWCGRAFAADRTAFAAPSTISTGRSVDTRFSIREQTAAHGKDVMVVKIDDITFQRAAPAVAFPAARCTQRGSIRGACRRAEGDPSTTSQFTVPTGHLRQDTPSSMADRRATGAGRSHPRPRIGPRILARRRSSGGGPILRQDRCQVRQRQRPAGIRAEILRHFALLDRTG
jgi:hypothetical protein